MSEPSEERVTSVISLLARSPASRRAVLAAIITAVGIVLMVFLAISAVVVMRVSNGADLDLGVVKVVDSKANGDKSEALAVTAAEPTTFDPESLSSHWFYYSIATTRIEDCNSIARDSLKVAGLQNIRSNFSSHRASASITNNFAYASVSCGKNGPIMLIFGDVTSNSSLMAKDLGTRVATAIEYERERRAADFLPPEHVTPFNWFQDAWLAHSLSVEDGKCIELSKAALAVANAAKIRVSGHAVFGVIEKGDIVAYCTDGIEGYPVSIVIAGFGDDGGMVKEAVNAAEAYIERRTNEAVEKEMLEMDAQMQLEGEVVVVPESQGTLQGAD